ncbi:MAG: hypothetical protein ACRDH7_09305 [Actinomycetota bacterium]
MSSLAEERKAEEAELARKRVSEMSARDKVRRLFAVPLGGE